MFAGMLSAIVGYRYGARIRVPAGKEEDKEASLHLSAWNTYVSNLRELAVVRLANYSNSPEPLEVCDTYIQAISSSATLASSIGTNFGSVAEDTFKSILADQVQAFDKIFVNISEGVESSENLRALYENGQRFSEYLNSLTMLFRYHELASHMKVLFDAVVRIPLDRKRTALTYETSNIDALLDHTSVMAKWFSTNLFKYYKLRCYIGRV